MLIKFTDQRLKSHRGAGLRVRRSYVIARARDVTLSALEVGFLPRKYGMKRAGCGVHHMLLISLTPDRECVAVPFVTGAFSLQETGQKNTGSCEKSHSDILVEDA